MAYSGAVKKCAHDGCKKKLVMPGRWDTTDWFVQRDGTAWCPPHFPEWVKGWRAKKAAEKLLKQETKAITSIKEILLDLAEGRAFGKKEG